MTGRYWQWALKISYFFSSVPHSCFCHHFSFILWRRAKHFANLRHSDCFQFDLKFQIKKLQSGVRGPFSLDLKNSGLVLLFGIFFYFYLTIFIVENIFVNFFFGFFIFEFFLNFPKVFFWFSFESLAPFISRWWVFSLVTFADQTRQMKRAYYCLDPRSSQPLTGGFQKGDPSDSTSFLVPVRPEPKQQMHPKTADFQPPSKDSNDHHNSGHDHGHRQLHSSHSGEQMKISNSNQSGSTLLMNSAAKYAATRRGSLPTIPIKGWPKNSPPGIKNLPPQRELQELIHLHGSTVSQLAGGHNSNSMRESTNSPSELILPPNPLLAMSAAVFSAESAHQQQQRNGASLSRGNPRRSSVLDLANSAVSERPQLASPPVPVRRSPPVVVKCRICQKIIDNANYIQCPSVSEHRFCFRCCKEMVSKATEESPATCPSGERWVLIRPMEM